MIAPYLDLAQIVRDGRTTLPDEGTVSPDNPIWMRRRTAPLMHPASLEIAELVAGDRAIKVLDAAAGHGLLGIAIAKRNPQAHITALDWPNVLAVATENAQQAGVADRHSTLPGDAFQVKYGGPYDLFWSRIFSTIFDPPRAKCSCESCLPRSPLAGDVSLEFVPNEDRVSPPTPAGFAMMMLGTTRSGDAYTAAEFEAMFRNAGFASSELHLLKNSPESVVISRARD